MPKPSTLAGQLDTSLLEDRCCQFMVQGLQHTSLTPQLKENSTTFAFRQGSFTLFV